MNFFSSCEGSVFRSFISNQKWQTNFWLFIIMKITHALVDPMKKHCALWVCNVLRAEWYAELNFTHNCLGYVVLFEPLRSTRVSVCRTCLEKRREYWEKNKHLCRSERFIWLSNIGRQIFGNTNIYSFRFEIFVLWLFSLYQNKPYRIGAFCLHWIHYHRLQWQNEITQIMPLKMRQNTNKATNKILKIHICEQFRFMCDAHETW